MHAALLIIFVSIKEPERLSIVPKSSSLEQQTKLRFSTCKKSKVYYKEK